MQIKKPKWNIQRIRWTTIIVTIPLIVGITPILYRRTFLGEEQKKIPMFDIIEPSDNVLMQEDKEKNTSE
ncbi:hypothetical protein G9A89_006049 [Geosiphon pyriformis]|nr:hypothetical protein G9A89_006049 [Geosiphon pyriformis]